YIVSGGGDKTIRIWDANTGEQIRTIPEQNRGILDLSISPDGNKVLTGIGGPGSGGNEARIFSIASGKELFSFGNHNNIVLATAFSPDGQLAATAGGSNFPIYLWDSQTGTVSREIAGKSDTIWSVGFAKDGNSIAWGKKFVTNSLFSYGTLEQTFILKEDGVFSPSLGPTVSDASKYQKALSKVGSLSIGTTNNTVDKTLKIMHNGSEINKVSRNMNGDSYYSLSLTPDGKKIIAAGSWDLESLDPKTGRKIKEFVGHTGVVWGIAVSPDSRWMISGSADQTIRLWDIESGNNLLTIFHASDNQWVAWTPAGYYASSSKGDDYIGWHLNQGENKSALYYPASRFDDKFRQPLVIANYLKSNGDIKEAIRLANQDRSRQQKKIERVMITDMQNILPPAVFFQKPSEADVISRKQDFCVKAGASSVNRQPITDIWLTLNGRKTRGIAVGSQTTSPQKRISGRRASIEQCFKLMDRANTISVFASNDHSQSDPDTIQVTWIAEKKRNKELDIYKPSLYVLSIGVSKYENPQFDLDVADADAKAVAEMFQEQEGRLFLSVNTQLLLNEKATRDNIMDGLEWLDQESTQKDVSIIFIAGHGVNDSKKNYYFLPYNANARKLRRTGVRWMEFQDTISSLPSKALLFVDTCHSGNITGKRRGVSDMTEAIRELSSMENGVVVMTASTGREESEERPEWGHGAFTKALIEGIKESRADFNRNGLVEIKELDLYITQRVKELTGGSQHPTTEIPKTLPNFPLSAK
ncbi:MAG: hypothetical protein GY850_02300, partial [bacterium]|nr:hypothetical protein [bacterium]